MVLPVLASSSGAAVEQLVEQAVRGSANKLLFDVLYQLQKDAGKVPVDCHGSARRVPSAWCTTHAGNAPCIYHAPRPDSKVLVVTAISAVAPSLSRLPMKSSTVVLGALALAASLIGTLLVGNASIEKGMVRGGGAALLLAVALLVVALIEHLRPRAPAAIVLDAAPSPPSWRPLLGRVALPAGAVAACGVPAVVLASRRAAIRQRRREETQRLLVKQGEALQRALALLARLGSASEEGTPAAK